MYIHGVYTKDMTKNENQTSTGYICKHCGGHSPIGVGYAASTKAASNAHLVTSCPCGWSTLG